MELRSGVKVGAEQIKGQLLPDAQVPTILMPPAARPFFEEGSRLLFARWTALRLAVENEWGGPSSKEKEQWLVQEAVQWCYKAKEHYADELEEELDDALLQDFNVEAEDNSPAEVAQAMVQLYKECARGDMTMLQRLRAQAAPTGTSRSKRQVVDRDGTDMGDDASSSSSDDDDNDGEAMDEDDKPARSNQKAPPPAPIVDSDGFELVQGKGRRGQ